MRAVRESWKPRLLDDERELRISCADNAKLPPQIQKLLSTYAIRDGWIDVPPNGDLVRVVVMVDYRVAEIEEAMRILEA